MTKFGNRCSFERVEATTLRYNDMRLHDMQTLTNSATLKQVAFFLNQVLTSQKRLSKSDGFKSYKQLLAVLISDQQSVNSEYKFEDFRVMLNAGKIPKEITSKMFMFKDIQVKPTNKPKAKIKPVSELTEKELNDIFYENIPNEPLIIEDDAEPTAPKKRGRPVGSKNKTTKTTATSDSARLDALEEKTKTIIETQLQLVDMMKQLGNLVIK